LRASEFIPFRSGIDAGAHMIMVGHVSMPGVVGDDTPCSLSEEVVTNWLRGELGYNGIVITDAMNMSAITEYYSADQAAVMALQAGVDMILMPDGFEAAYEGVLAAVRDGVISEERINESLKRIYRIKYRDRVDQDGNVVDNMAAEQQTGEGGEEISANPEEAPDSQPEGEAAPAIQEGEPAE